MNFYECCDLTKKVYLIYLIYACILLRKGFLTNALAGGYIFEYGDFSTMQLLKLDTITPLKMLKSRNLIHRQQTKMTSGPHLGSGFKRFKSMYQIVSKDMQTC